MGLIYRACQSSANALSRLLWGIRIEGLENVPREGALLVTANHRSNLDPPLLGAVLPREVGYAAKKELFEVPGLGALIRALNAIPVNRSNMAPSTLRRFESWLGEGKALLIFPEGTRQRSGLLGEAKAGVGLLVERFRVPVLPIWIEGTESPFRNVFRRGRVRVVIGSPYTLPEEIDGRETERERYERTARTIMSAIGRLARIESHEGRTERPE